MGQCHLQSISDQLLIIGFTHCPAYDQAHKQIQDHDRTQPTSAVQTSVVSLTHFAILYWVRLR
ncbi:hypothetical protein KSF_040300 [Reticulibacter mediterranei]|uniref:Uncharacterized protein n=1 Tax=Reticulibacter mediterranei TaxID=2778369 RepID=A0A8J3N1F9_9CHLR|nr:hypothetical protein KSF_040300 [Reticulibacter mediterranei]